MTFPLPLQIHRHLGATEASAGRSFVDDALHRLLASPPCIASLHRLLASPPCIASLHRLLASPPCIASLHRIVIGNPRVLLCLGEVKIKSNPRNRKRR